MRGLMIFLLILAIPFASAEGKGLKLTVNADTSAYVGVVYSNLFKITNLDHVTGQTDSVNVTLYYNLTKDDQVIKQETVMLTGINSYKTSGTGSFSVSEAGNYLLCGQIMNSSANDTDTSDDSACETITVIDTSSTTCNISLGLSLNGSIFQSGETIRYEHVLSNESFPFTIRYWIEDLFGEVVKDAVESTNTNKKSWTPKIDALEKAFLIKSELKSLSCNDIDDSDNYVERLIVVKGEPKSKSSESSITILDSDDGASFGDIVNVKVSVYKGDTGAYAVTALVKGKSRISEETKFYAYSKFTNYTLRLPIQLYQNCDGKYDDGDYTISVSGLDDSATRKIKLTGSACKASTKSSALNKSEAVSSTGKFTYEFLSYPEQANIGDTINTQVKLDSDEDDHNISIYSYIRKGSKIYGEKEDNLQKVLLPASGSVVVQLNNIVAVTKNGTYDLVIKLRKDDQKTEKQLNTTFDVSLPSKDSANAQQASSSTKTSKSNATTVIKYASVKDDPFWYENRVDESVHVFESATQKSQRYIPYSIIGALALVSLFALLLKKIT